MSARRYVVRWKADGNAVHWAAGDHPLGRMKTLCGKRAYGPVAELALLPSGVVWCVRCREVEAIEQKGRR